MPTTSYAHFRDVPESAWRWPSFSPAEIASRREGALKINTEAMDKLQSLRNRLGKPLIVRSGYRSPSHNSAVGGAPASKHMLGTAFDIAMSNHDPATFAEAAHGVCQRSCPSISCGVSDFRGAGFGFGVQPYWSGGLPVSGFT